MIPTSNLVIDGALKNEMLLYLNLLKVVVYRVDKHCLLIGYGDRHPPKANVNKPKLVERDPKCMQLVVKCVCWFDNEIVLQLHEMFCIESHIGFEPTGWRSTQVT